MNKREISTSQSFSTHGHSSILCSNISHTHRLAQSLRSFPGLPPLGWVSLKLPQTNESILKRLSINNLIAQFLGTLILNSRIYQLQSFFTKTLVFKHIPYHIPWPLNFFFDLFDKNANRLYSTVPEKGTCHLLETFFKKMFYQSKAWCVLLSHVTSLQHHSFIWLLLSISCALGTGLDTCAPGACSLRWDWGWGGADEHVSNKQMSKFY